MESGPALEQGEVSPGETATTGENRTRARHLAPLLHGHVPGLLVAVTLTLAATVAGLVQPLLVKDVIDAYVERDPNKALEVWNRDEELDEM